MFNLKKLWRVNIMKKKIGLVFKLIIGIIVGILIGSYVLEIIV